MSKNKILFKWQELFYIIYICKPFYNILLIVKHKLHYGEE